jgi:hypothetical protein
MINREVSIKHTESKVLNYLKEKLKAVENYEVFDTRIPAEGIPAIKSDSYPCPQFKPFDISKFGKYFNKCCGKLNSIIKEDGFYVCKDRIGIKLNGRKRNIYADDDDVFVILDQRHLKLVCNDKKSDVMNDFVSLKNEIIVRIREIEAKIKILFPSEFRMSKAVNIKYEIANIRAGTLGYCLTEPEVLQLTEDSLILNFGSLSSMLVPISSYTAYIYKYMINNCLKKNMLFSFAIEGTSDHGYSNHVYDYNNERNMLLIMKNGNNYDYRYTQSIRVDNHQNLVYDFNPELIYNEFVKEYEILVEWYDGALEKLKQKHSVNWFLNSLDDSDCLI